MKSSITLPHHHVRLPIARCSIPAIVDRARRTYIDVDTNAYDVRASAVVSDHTAAFPRTLATAASRHIYVLWSFKAHILDGSDQHHR